MNIDKERVMVKNLYKEKRVGGLARYFFNFKPTQRQKEIIRSILYGDKPKVLISASTQYGKTKCVTIALSLYILFNQNREIFVISSLDSKSKNMRNMMMENIIECPILAQLLLTEAKGREKLLKEVSKKRMTFKNGCSVQFFSAEGDGQRLMGFGIGKGGKLVIDEIAEIKREVVNTKILRMMGASSETTQFVAMFTPWTKDSAAYDMWLRDDYHNIHINWHDAVDEGRYTQQFVDDMKAQLFDWEFEVLYNSNFPDEMEDGIFNYKDLEVARNKSTIKTLNPEITLACDVAAYGADWTVLMVVEKDQRTGDFQIIEIQDYHKQSTTVTTGYIVELIEKYKPDNVNVDNGGMGVAVCDMIEEQGHQVKRVNFGGTPGNDRYLNLKAHMYFKLKEIFELSKIIIPNHNKLIKELSSMRFQKMSSNKIKIIDPEKSPDYADALAIAIAHECINESYVMLDGVAL